MTALSPAAQAVLDAFNNAPFDEEHGEPHAIAAALRAVADQIDHDWSAFNCIDALYEIATELEKVA